MIERAPEGDRSCVGCRQTDARDALLRFVVAGLPRAGQGEGETEPVQIAPDVRRRAPGRGVSVHPRLRCVEAAVRTGALRRGLGVGDAPSASALELSRMAAEQYRRRAVGLLSSAKRARRLTLGTEATRTAIEELKLRVLLVASDAEGHREELVAAAERLGGSCLVWSNKQELGRLFGRALLSIVGVLDAGIASELRQVVRCASELAEDA
jgi:ribosomal protein L7Ae-like RNA K-turn-binding protein